MSHTDGEDAAIVQDVSSESGDEYDPIKEDGPDQEDEEEEVLDESSASDLKQSKAKKKLKKTGRGQLHMAIQSARGKDLPVEWKAKRKASDREER